jgi:hypothetical protein
MAGLTQRFCQVTGESNQIQKNAQRRSRPPHRKWVVKFKLVWCLGGERRERERERGHEKELKSSIQLRRVPNIVRNTVGLEQYFLFCVYGLDCKGEYSQILCKFSFYSKKLLLLLPFLAFFFW